MSKCECVSFYLVQGLRKSLLTDQNYTIVKSGISYTTWEQGCYSLRGSQRGISRTPVQINNYPAYNITQSYFR